MYNIQPGMGLGFTGSKEIALGLGFVAIAVSAAESAYSFIKALIQRSFSHD